MAGTPSESALARTDGVASSAEPVGEGPSRRARLLAGLDAISDRGKGAATSRTMLVAALLSGVGLALVLVGWYGASRTPNLHEQVPYLISGGLFGLGLCFLGGSAYYAHWVAAVVREQRAQTDELVRAVTELGDRLTEAMNEKDGKP